MRKNKVLLFLLSLMIFGSSGCLTNQKPSVSAAQMLWLQGDSLCSAYRIHNTMEESKALHVITFFENAIAQDPYHIAAHNGRGIILNYLGRNEEAIAEYKTVLELDPNFDAAYNNLGIIYNNMGEIEKAVEVYEKSIEVSPNKYDPYYSLGILYHDEGDYKKSAKYYNLALEIEPDYAFTYHNLGNTYMGLKEYSNAINVYTVAIELDSVYKKAWNGRGMAHTKLLHFNEAISDFEKALSIPTQYYNSEIDSYTYNNMANCYNGLGKTEEACMNWRKALSMGYVYKAIWKVEYGIDDPVLLVQEFCN